MLEPVSSSAAFAILLFWHGLLSIRNSLFILLSQDFIHAAINARGNGLHANSAKNNPLIWS